MVNIFSDETEFDIKQTRYPTAGWLSAKTALLFSILFFTSIASAHEFWIEPVTGSSPGSPVVTELRNGESFEGVAYPYNADLFVRFDLLSASSTLEISNSTNALPAVNITPDTDGPHTLLYVSNRKYLEYEAFSDVREFAAEDGVTETLDALVADGVATDNWTETYTRYTKSLLNVGGQLLKDKSHDLELEIILLQPLQATDRTNPDELSPSNDREVLLRLDYLGKPLEGGMIGIFQRSRSMNLGTINVLDSNAAVHRNKASFTSLTKVRTGSDGTFTLNLEPGHDYLLNSVYAKPAGDKLFTIPGLPDKRKVSWETIWSSLTFSY